MAFASEFFLTLRGPSHVAEALQAERPEDDLSHLAARLGTFLAVLAGFVSITTTGRLVAAQMVATVIAWSFLPLLQALSLFAALRSAGQRPRFARAFSHYLTGHGPWMLLLLAVSLVCLVAPDAYKAFTWMLSKGVLPALMLATIVWSVFLTRGYFRHILGLAPHLARRATGVFYVTLVALIVGWYTAVGDLLPLFGVYP